MAEQYSIKIPAHPNIYQENKNTGRELRIDFSTPQDGVNAKTALLMLVPGFGGNIDSNVYKKMRETFADTYNLVTIQCEYFGSKFMQGADQFLLQDKSVLPTIFSNQEMRMINQNASNIFQLIRDREVVLTLQADLKESMDEFNDMSFMQAIDVITAIDAVKLTLEENGLEFDSERVIGYGHSHGSYLLYLSNLFKQGLYSYIVDNSAWLQPVYFTGKRFLSQQLGKAMLSVEFDYMAKHVIKDKKALDLNVLYKNFSGRTQFIVFQGDQDHLVDHIEKKQLVESINEATFFLVTDKDIDHKKYRSTAHGLDADFLELFSYALEFESSPKQRINHEDNYELDFNGFRIRSDCTHGLPLFNVLFE